MSTSTFRRVLGVAAVAGLGATLATGAAQAAGPVTCGSVITTSTALTTDLVCAGTGDALVIGADNVVLDLKGHSITGPGAGPSTGAGVRAAERTGVTITNGTVSGFEHGVAVDTTHYTTVSKISSHHNIRGVEVANGDHLLVTRNTLWANEGDAIRVGGSDDSVIGQNVATDNVFGIFVADFAGTVSVTRNVVTGTRNAGLAVFSGTTGITLSQNTVSSGWADGINVAADTTSTVVSQNTVTLNAGDGIDAAGTSTLAQNLATWNGQLGIRATSDVTDGGGNKAAGNGDLAQCVGVVCSAP